MKSIISFLVFFIYSFFFFSPGLSAQPTLEMEVFPNIGDSYTVNYITDPVFDPGTDGPNTLWDFSNLGTDLAITYKIIPPSEGVGSSSFPEADFAWNILEFDQYSFYQIDGNDITLLGGANGTPGDITFMTIYQNLEDAFRLPITYGTTYDYESTFDNYLFGNLLSSGARMGTVTADGYGTLVTPNGTFDNVLRIKIESESGGIMSTQYAWWSTRDFIPLLQYETSSDPDEDDFVVYAKNNNPSTDVAELEFLKSNFSVYSNSTELIVNIDASTPMKEIQFILSTLNGKRILLHNIESHIDDNQSIIIPTNIELNPGAYVLTLQSKSGNSSKIFYHQ